jgi:hypothetical protein
VVPPYGEAGFVSRQEVARLINLVNQNSPMDVVIFYDGCNDCRSLCRADVSINGTREEFKIAKKVNHRWQLIDALFGSIQTVVEKVIKKGKRPPSLCWDNLDYAKKVASTLVNNWKVAKALVALGGQNFMLFFSL